MRNGTVCVCAYASVFINGLTHFFAIVSILSPRLPPSTPRYQIHLHMHPYTQTYIHTYIHTYLHPSIHLCIIHPTYYTCTRRARPTRPLVLGSNTSGPCKAKTGEHTKALNSVFLFVLSYVPPDLRPHTLVA